MQTNDHQLIIKPDSIMILRDFVGKEEQNPVVYPLQEIIKVEFRFKHQSRLKNVVTATADIMGTLMGATSGSSLYVCAILSIELISAKKDIYELEYGTLDNAKRDVSQLKKFLNNKLKVLSADELSGGNLK
jgi:hypothetical protein